MKQGRTKQGSQRKDSPVFPIVQRKQHFQAPSWTEKAEYSEMFSHSVMGNSMGWKGRNIFPTKRDRSPIWMDMSG